MFLKNERLSSLPEYKSDATDFDITTPPAPTAPCMNRYNINADEFNYFKKQPYAKI
jgi:hypothetical protein